jgi:hypothetical protein
MTTQNTQPTASQKQETLPEIQPQKEKTRAEAMQEMLDNPQTPKQRLIALTHQNFLLNNKSPTATIPQQSSNNQTTPDSSNLQKVPSQHQVTPASPTANTLFTDEQYEKKIELFSILSKMTTYHIENGIRKFADFAKEMKSISGNNWEKTKLYLLGFWQFARQEFPQFENEIDDLNNKEANAIIAEIENTSATTIEQSSELFSILSKMSIDIDRALAIAGARMECCHIEKGVREFATISKEINTTNLRQAWFPMEDEDPLVIPVVTHQGNPPANLSEWKNALIATVRYLKDQADTGEMKEAKYLLKEASQTLNMTEYLSPERVGETMLTLMEIMEGFDPLQEMIRTMENWYQENPNPKFSQTEIQEATEGLANYDYPSYLMELLPVRHDLT